MIIAGGHKRRCCRVAARGERFREAERLLDEATSRGDFNPRAQWCLELVKLHTALAHVAATALTCDGREWTEVAGSRFCDLSLALQHGRT